MCSHYTTGPGLSFVDAALEDKFMRHKEIVTNKKPSHKTPFDAQIPSVMQITTNRDSMR